MRDELLYAIAQLRHAYKQLVNGSVKDQKRFAEGLIGPQIRTLETILGGLNDSGNGDHQ